MFPMSQKTEGWLDRQFSKVMQDFENLPDWKKDVFQKYIPRD